MMQNSLERLLQGMAETLARTVAPATDDPYASAQAMAAAELLLNLAERVTWDPGYLLAHAEETRGLVEDAGLGAAPAGDDPAALERHAAAHLTALSQAAARAWTDGTPAGERERVAALVDAELDGELARLRRPASPK
jgi:hypothetical protein